MGHPRAIEGSVRTQETKRRRQRRNKAFRKQQQKSLEEQTIKEQKTTKRKAIQQKSPSSSNNPSRHEYRLTELNTVCGDEVDVHLLEKLLDSDKEFDVDEWNREMEDVFDEDYYKVIPSPVPLTHPHSNRKRMHSMRQTKKRRLTASHLKIQGSLHFENLGSHLWMQFEFEAVDEERDAKLEGIEKTQELRTLMRDYYALDREDTIEDISCRYRYIKVRNQKVKKEMLVKVPKEDFGLEPHDVLCLDDKQLNGYVGLRRLNPYRDDLSDYQPKPWRLRQLLNDVSYTGRKGQTETEQHRTVNHSLEVKETELADKIRQESDVNVKARLASYSHNTLKPYQSKKLAKTSTDVQQLESTEAVKKSHRKNLKRKLMRNQKQKSTTE